MGITLWLASGVFAFLLARIVPLARRPRWLPELALGILVAFLLGVLATALDFGGWAELDWRAAAFSGCGSFAAIGMLRAVQSAQSFRRIV
ncbi:MAG TPA: hypothetical protein VNA69_14625 [Thermoanaerobaculia bacterium]|nr:hypothetical protein [Thermoanaerobaculia bacterium]